MLKYIIIAYVASIVWSFSITMILIIRARNLAKEMNKINNFDTILVDIFFTLLYALIPILNINMGIQSMDLKPIDLVHDMT